MNSAFILAGPSKTPPEFSVLSWSGSEEIGKREGDERQNDSAMEGEVCEGENIFDRDNQEEKERERRKDNEWERETVWEQERGAKGIMREGETEKIKTDMD